MPKFMNDELRAIRDSLSCGHCGSIFHGSDSQAWKVKYEKKVVYCSTICRHAGVFNKLRKPVPNRGPCKTCGQTFYSRTAKIYCSLNCYVRSEQFKDVQAKALLASRTPEAREKIAAGLRTGKTFACMECGEECYSSRQRARKFCSQSCYRSYLAKRFDRWVANPEGLALPQCYDEFLDKEELCCVVDGCSWKGQNLSTHMNFTHGVRATEVKRAAGFNRSTGLVARPLAQALQQREMHHDPKFIADMVDRLHAWRDANPEAASANGNRGAPSNEHMEHHHKARALKLLEPGPVRFCLGCGVEFQQSTPYGRALYCTISCRESAYGERRRRTSTSEKNGGRP
jgi:hypothetical protein